MNADLFIRTRNVIRADAALKRAAKRGRMLLVRGSAGAGKTQWSRSLRSDESRVVVTVRLGAMMTPALALFEVLSGLEQAHLKRERRPFDQRSGFLIYLDIKRVLEQARRPTTLVIDESDYCAWKRPMQRFVYALRDLADYSEAHLTIVWLSVASLAQQLAAPTDGLGAAVQSRTETVEFGAITIDDVMLLARESLDVQLSRDLVAMLLKRTDGSLRALVPQLEEIESVAHAARVITLDLAAYERLIAPPTPPPREAKSTALPSAAARKVA